MLTHVSKGGPCGKPINTFAVGMLHLQSLRENEYQQTVEYVQYSVVPHWPRIRQEIDISVFPWSVFT